MLTIISLEADKTDKSSYIMALSKDQQQDFHIYFQQYQYSLFGVAISKCQYYHFQLKMTYKSELHIILSDNFPNREGCILIIGSYIMLCFLYYETLGEQYSLQIVILTFMIICLKNNTSGRQYTCLINGLWAYSAYDITDCYPLQTVCIVIIVLYSCLSIGILHEL